MATVDDFAIFILTHGRPNKVKTFNTLREQGYTGRIYLIVDNEDDYLGEYVKRFGDAVVVFDKSEMVKRSDAGDNFVGMNNVVLFARNAAFDIAQKMGIKYFYQFDDDYSAIVYKFDNNFVYCEKKVYSLDKLFCALLDFYKKIPALSIAIAQNGDFIGGKDNQAMGGSLKLRRKCMNTFLCSTDRRFWFYGRINEDVNCYVCEGRRGKLFFTIPNVAVIQTTTQKNKGGLTETYLDLGTYVKSFYSILYCPSAVKISMMGYKHKRIHHEISWNNAVPKILEHKNG